MISELWYFIDVKKTPHLVKHGFEERIDQVGSIFDSSFHVYGLHITCLCMNFLWHARIGFSSLV